jgi:hypothetical protein
MKNSTSQELLVKHNNPRQDVGNAVTHCGATEREFDATAGRRPE